LGCPGRRFDTSGGCEITASFGVRYGASQGQSEPMGIEWYGESYDSRGYR